MLNDADLDTEQRLFQKDEFRYTSKDTYLKNFIKKSKIKQISK